MKPISSNVRDEMKTGNLSTGFIQVEIVDDLGKRRVTEVVGTEMLQWVEDWWGNAEVKTVTRGSSQLSWEWEEVGEPGAGMKLPQRGVHLCC